MTFLTITPITIIRRLLGVLESKLDLKHLRIRATSIDSYWDDLSNHQKTSVRQSNLRATRTSLLLFWGNPCAIFFLWGEGEGVFQQINCVSNKTIFLKKMFFQTIHCFPKYNVFCFQKKFSKNELNSQIIINKYVFFKQ